MWKHNSSKFITSNTEARSLTHLLAIPLLSPVSRPAFRNSITRLLDDPSAASVPRHDIRPLGTLHLRVTTMNLTNPKRFAQSIEILRTLNFKNILEVAATGSKEEVGPLSVSVRGLQPGNIGTEANAITLSTNVVDVTNRLKPFIDMMRNAYREAGLLYLNHSRNAETRRIRQENEVSSTFGMILLKSKHQQRRYIPDRKIRGKLRQAPLPRYDFRDIINQYKDKTWSDEIKLDRVSICQLGLAKSLRHQDGGMDSDIGLSEVFSVPLP
jgi:activating signal cointegrator complex subunit 1